MAYDATNAKRQRQWRERYIYSGLYQRLQLILPHDAAEAFAAWAEAEGVSKADLLARIVKAQARLTAPTPKDALIDLSQGDARCQARVDGNRCLNQGSSTVDQEFQENVVVRYRCCREHDGLAFRPHPSFMVEARRRL